MVKKEGPAAHHCSIRRIVFLCKNLQTFRVGNPTGLNFNGHDLPVDLS